MNINVCFHGIGVCTREREDGEARYWVREAEFLRMLDALAGQPDVRLSFDDGNTSDAAVALPALRERNLRGTFFALAGRLDDPASLSATDLRHLRTEGMSIGNHGWAHIPWRALTDASADRELIQARAALVDASAGPIDEAAFPLGRYDRDLLSRLRKLNYRTVYSSDQFPARPGSWLQARYSVTADDTAESIAKLINHRLRPRDARNVLASTIKRLR